MIENILSLLFSKLVFLALHIDNPGIFPPALKAVEEEKLLQQMQDGNENARKKLIEHNLRLVVHVIKKYYAADCEQDDLISIGTL